MSFDSGSQSLTICKLPQSLPDNALDLFHSHKAQALKSVMSEPQTGWVSGRHLLEERIDDDTAYRGGYLYLNLRTAVRKIPSTLFKAKCQMEELAQMQAQNSFVLPRKQKKEIRERVHDELIKDMPPNISGIPFVVDAKNSILLLGAVSQRQIDGFMAYFAETFRFEPVPMYPDLLATDLFKVETNHLPVLRFTPDPDKFDDTPLLGRDFATWLWYFQEEEGGIIETADYGEFAIAIDGPLSFASEGSGAMESVVRKGLPTISAEAKAALTVGKKLTRARYILVRDSQEWSFSLDSDTFTFRSMKLPEGEELDPLSHFQERVLFYNIFRQAFNTLFGNFLDVLSNPDRTKVLQEKLIAWSQGLQSH